MLLGEAITKTNFPENINEFKVTELECAMNASEYAFLWQLLEHAGQTNVPLFGTSEEHFRKLATGTTGLSAPSNYIKNRVNKSKVVMSTDSFFQSTRKSKSGGICCS